MENEDLDLAVRLMLSLSGNAFPLSLCRQLPHPDMFLLEKICLSASSSLRFAIHSKDTVRVFWHYVQDLAADPYSTRAGIKACCLRCLGGTCTSSAAEQTKPQELKRQDLRTLPQLLLHGQILTGRSARSACMKRPCT